MAVISVILPTYNSVETVDRAVQSVFAQTFTDWELIAIDDASTDNTVAFMRERYGSDPRVTLLTRQVNGGPAEARNLAIQHATGDWITLLDSDDAWSCDRLEVLYSSHEDSDFIADNIMTYDAFSKTETGTLFEDFDRPIMTLDDLLAGWVGNKRVDGGYLKPLMRAQFLRGAELSYDSRLRHGEDFVFYCEALCRRARFRLLNSHGYIYTTSIGRLSNQSSPHSRTTPDPIAISQALRLLSEKYSQYLDTAELKALDHFVNGLSRSKWPWAFEAAKKNRDYFSCFKLIVRHHTVQRHVAKALLSEIGLGPTARRSVGA